MARVVMSQKPAGCTRRRVAGLPKSGRIQVLGGRKGINDPGKCCLDLMALGLPEGP